MRRIVVNKNYIVKTDINSWDQNIREIGNIVYNDKTEEYLLYYSGHVGENVRGKNDIYVGIATSKDLVNWQKIGKVMDEYAEDPFVIFCQDRYWMFYEEKTKIPDDSVSLAVSDDGEKYTVFARNIIVPVENSFQSRDTSSPVAVCLKDKVVVLYEAREKDVVGATLGYAESKDFLNWHQNSKPAFSLGKNRFIVPDDIQKKDNVFFFTFHDVDELLSVGRTDWLSKGLISDDLINWEPYKKIFSGADYLMFLKDDLFYTSDEFGIFVTSTFF